eukprot:332216-Pelagomonas_calceolata.AAC.3
MSAIVELHCKYMTTYSLSSWPPSLVASMSLTVGESVDGGLPVPALDAAINALHWPASHAHVVLQHIQHARELAKNQHPARSSHAVHELGTWRQSAKAVPCSTHAHGQAD